MFRPPGPSSRCVEDFSKSTMHYWMFLNGGFGVGGGGGKEVKERKEQKGRKRGRGEGEQTRSRFL
jgi:hypothetical protein